MSVDESMDISFPSIITLIVLAGWIIYALAIAFSQRKFTWITIINIFASTCLVVGALGFLGLMLSADTGLGLPNSFEWPIGNAGGALELSDGTVIIPHEPSGRIQVYNQSLEFQLGWHINASGGDFKLIPASGNLFYVYTVRNDMKYLYDTNGSLLMSERYYGSYPDETSLTINVSIPTPFYLLVFAYPFASFSVAMIGILILLITRRARVKKNLTSHISKWH